MKKRNLLIVIAFMAFLSAASSQTMKVQTKNGDKTYNISEVEKITFGKKAPSLIEMIAIPAGTFRMGNTGSWIASIAEGPAHDVTITKSFLIGKFEVTQKQYFEIMGENPSYYKGDDLPVETISWIKATEFCNLLSAKEGLQPCYSGKAPKIMCDWNANGYRLPTEAEWEIACKAGTTTDLYNGKEVTVDQCVPLDENVDEIAWFCANGEDITHIVGLKKPNAFGLYDMNGNVWEWCWDWFVINNSAYKGEAETDPIGANAGDGRIFRGGSFRAFASYQRSSYRTFGNPSLPGRKDIGFRVVRYK